MHIYIPNHSFPLSIIPLCKACLGFETVLLPSTRWRRSSCAGPELLLVPAPVSTESPCLYVLNCYVLMLTAEYIELLYQLQILLSVRDYIPM